jgi:hypothetical protein
MTVAATATPKKKHKKNRITIELPKRKKLRKYIKAITMGFVRL